MCWTLIHYFHKYFLSSYYILDTSPVLDAEGSVVNKIDKNPCFCGTDILERETVNKRVNKNINEI